MSEREAEINEVTSRAVENGSYMIAAFRFKDGVIDLDRLSNDFPLEQFKAAIHLFKQNLIEELDNKGFATNIHPRSSLSGIQTSNAQKP